MEPKQLALKLFLDELDVPSNIATVDDRKRVQKAVDLGQRAGADLGYRFGWYIMGPYSPGLTRDYYGLAEAILSGDSPPQGRVLHPKLRERLQKVKPLLDAPNGFASSQEDWLELVASLDYLRRVRRLGSTQARRALAEAKPHLSKWADLADQQLKSAGLD